MRKQFMFWALLIGLMTACKKENTTPTPDPEPNPEIHFTTQSFSVEENSTAQTLVGKASAHYQDGNPESLLFSFDDNSDNNPFTIDATTGQITVKGTFELNHETTQSFDLAATVIDKNDEKIKTTTTITVNLIDVDETPQTNLMGYYPLDGNTNDVSGYDNHGDLNSDTSLFLVENRFGETNMAYDFSKDGYVNVPNFQHYDDMSAFTIGTWIQINELSNSNGISSFITKAAPGRDFMLGFENSRRLDFHFYEAGYVFCQSPENTFEVGEWFHFIASFSEGKMLIYLNGVLVAEKETTKTPPWNSENLTFGNYQKVQLDDIRIYNKVFTQAEIDKWMEEESIKD